MFVPSGSTRASVFFGQHDGDDALGDRWIGRVRRVSGQGLVVIIDLEKDHGAIGFKRAEIVFAIRIVGVAKIVVDRDGLNNSGDSFGAKGGDAAVMTA